MRSFLFFALVLASCGGSVASVDDAGKHPNDGGVGAPSNAVSEPEAPCDAPTGVETIADMRGDPNMTTGRIVADAAHLYVDTNRGTFRLRKCGGSAPLKLADNTPGQYAATGLVDAGDALYLAAIAPVHGGFVRRVDKAGGGATDVVTTSRELFGLAYVGGDDPRLYWAERGDNADVLREMHLQGGAVTTVASMSVAYSYGPFWGDASGVTFFAQTDSNHGTLSTFASGALTSLAAIPAPVDLIPGLDASSEAYFSFGHTGQNGVSRILRSATSSPELLIASAAPYGLSRRDQTLYFTDAAGGVVHRCELGTSGACAESAPVAAGEDDPRFITVDDGAVYWATWRGLVRRAPR